MTETGIIIRNFFRMMRSGALNEYVELEPMSRFKWNKLVDIILVQDVASVAARAVKNFQFEPKFNMPQDIREKIYEEGKNAKAQTISLAMTNGILNKKFNKIHTAERTATDCSMASLKLFEIIMANCHAILNHGISTRLVIQLGNHLRLKSNEVDFNKVDRWLSEIQMTRVAQLVGSVLINNFAFKREEVPFVKKVDPKAAQTMMECIINGKQQKVNRGITYFDYAPLENASILLGRMKDRLEIIEE